MEKAIQKKEILDELTNDIFDFKEKIDNFSSNIETNLYDIDYIQGLLSLAREYRDVFLDNNYLQLQKLSHRNYIFKRTKLHLISNLYGGKDIEVSETMYSKLDKNTQNTITYINKYIDAYILALETLLYIYKLKKNIVKVQSLINKIDKKYPKLYSILSSKLKLNKKTDLFQEVIEEILEKYDNILKDEIKIEEYIEFLDAKKESIKAFSLGLSLNIIPETGLSDILSIFPHTYAVLQYIKSKIIGKSI